MTLKELLDAKDAAVIADDDATAHLEDQRAALAVAEQVKVDSAAARVAAHKAIHDLLADKGHHHIVSEDGTVTIYAATDDNELGWRSYQPIPGS